MLNSKKFSTEVAGKTLTLEVSQMAEQTNAAVLAKYGDTVVLITAVMAEKDAANLDYLPLKVDYEERFYAAGKIIGSRYVRREGKSSEEAVLSGRLVDRVIRPLFDHRLRREMQVVATVLAIDEENDPDFVGLMGASTALAISDIPWNGPAAGVRVAKIGEEYVVNPTNSQMQDPAMKFETFAAGIAGKINMIELSGKEALDEIETTSTVDGKDEKLRLGILAYKPDFVLHRQDENLEYHFTEETGKHLLSLPSKE